MRTTQEIKDELDKIGSDERLQRPPADVFTNAPLALIQVMLLSRYKALVWVLGEMLDYSGTEFAKIEREE